MKIINTFKNILKYGRFYKEAQLELDKLKILRLIQDYLNKYDHFLCVLLLNFRFISVDAYKYLQDDIDRVTKSHGCKNHNGWSISSEYGSKNSLQIRQLWIACQIRIAEDKLKAQEESFVKVRSNPAQDKLTLQLDILKFIIADKMQEAETKATAVARQQQRQKLEEVLASKQEDALKGLTIEELQAQINALKA